VERHAKSPSGKVGYMSKLTNGAVLIVNNKYVSTDCQYSANRWYNTDLVLVQYRFPNVCLGVTRIGTVLA